MKRDYYIVFTFYGPLLARSKYSYIVGLEGKNSKDFFYSKVVVSGPGNCYLTFIAVDLLSTSEYVLLKEYTTGLIPIIFAYQSKKKKKKKLRMSHSPKETRCVIIFHTFIIFYTTSVDRKKINILAYRYTGRGLAAEG